MKDPNLKLETFSPVANIKFPDGMKITFLLGWDPDEISSGFAFHDKEQGYCVVIEPAFFQESDEVKVFVLLHEIGHIRLGHCDPENEKGPILSFGKDSNEDRIRLMKKGKVQYVEKNADLYAILNGCALYSILDIHINQDYDKKTKSDYTWTNLEIANRYRDAHKRSRKLWGPTGRVESTLDDIVGEVTYEMVYYDTELNHLSDDERHNLYNIVKECADSCEFDMNKPLEFSTMVEYVGEKIRVRDEILKHLNEKRDDLIVEGIITNDMSENLYVVESLTSKQRKKIPTEKFGIPSLRKYPLDTRKHVLSAIKLFGHCPEEHRKELAENIVKAMKEFDIPMETLSKTSKIRNYVSI